MKNKGIFVQIDIHNQNLRELSVNIISRFTIWVKRKLSEWQFSLFFRDF